MSEFKFNERKFELKISFERIAFIFFIFFIIFLIFSSKIVHLGIYNLPEKKSLKKKENFRASIVDREGNIIAKSVRIINLGIDPKLVVDKKKLSLSLRLLFPDQNFENKLNADKFFYVKKKISPKKLEQVLKLGEKAFRQEEKLARVYPNGELFSHIIGQIDDNNNGISGIEKSFDYELRSSKNSLQLSVDKEIQYLIRQELIKSKDIFNHIGSSAILMNIHNGEILSMISLPDFDLNKRKKLDDLKYINRATKGVYELGSVFKTFTIAAGFNYDVIKPDTEFKNLEKKISCDKNLIKEYDNKIPTDLSAEQILIRSGNIGSVRIAQKVGIDKYEEFLNKIGILSNITFDTDEVGTTQIGKWGKCKLATVAFGHGIATTLLQLTKAYSIVTNGGYEVIPKLIKDKKKREKVRVINRNVSKQINPILRKIVSTKEGTAGFADVDGFDIGGKTGTADQPVRGQYSKKKINTFASIFPSSNPKFVLIVMLDEPKPNKEFVYHYRDDRLPYKGNWRNTAGWTTVWVTGQIIEKIGPILAIKY